LSCVGCGDVTAVMYELAWLAQRTTRRPRVRPGGLSAASTVGGRAAEFLDFLTDGQVAAYGRFDGVPSWADLERFFILDDADRDLIGDRRGDHNRLGFVLQATTARYVGVFGEDPVDVPRQVVEYLAAQLGIEVDPSCTKRYTDRLPRLERASRTARAGPPRAARRAGRCGCRGPTGCRRGVGCAGVDRPTPNWSLRLRGWKRWCPRQTAPLKRPCGCCWPSDTARSCRSWPC